MELRLWLWRCFHAHGGAERAAHAPHGFLTRARSEAPPEALPLQGTRAPSLASPCPDPGTRARHQPQDRPVRATAGLDPATRASERPASFAAPRSARAGPISLSSKCTVTQYGAGAKCADSGASMPGFRSQLGHELGDPGQVSQPPCTSASLQTMHNKSSSPPPRGGCEGHMSC